MPWTKAVSWSMMKRALDCPRALKRFLEDWPESDSPMPTRRRARVVGITVQKVFEEFYNQGLHANPKAHTVDNMRPATEKVLASKWYEAQHGVFGDSTDEALRDNVRGQVAGGWQIFSEMGLLS